MALPPLDILLYGHDGRGLGHASRTIGIGMALRRLYPRLRVLFVSGCRLSQELIGAAPLDWLKLPSYETAVVDGTSRGIDGTSNFSDSELATLRSETLRTIIKLYRPRLVLADHSPQGKHKELVAALEHSGGTNTRWVLGVRGVIGAVPQLQSERGQRLFERYFSTLLWYGDRAVLGESHLLQLQRHFGVAPVECGYVSRAAEVSRLHDSSLLSPQKLAGTISIPWLGESTAGLLTELAEAIRRLGPQWGAWRLFVGVDAGSEEEKTVQSLFGTLPNCFVEPPGSRYLSALAQSQCAVIYGGYNSLMDVLYRGLPTVVLLREMRDNEQQIHLNQLMHTTPHQFLVLSEAEATREDIYTALQRQLSQAAPKRAGVNLEGAPRAAHTLVALLNQQPT